eukprot:COSAG03_NODE_19077_length_343_cov_0.635246_1_plen_39_part_10
MLHKAEASSSRLQLPSFWRTADSKAPISYTWAVVSTLCT